jgi:diketogulonate reductase-like aldo/keto reductase
MLLAVSVTGMQKTTKQLQIPKLALRNGGAIPIVGFGTWGLEDAEEMIAYALESGYRHIDTAKIYGTEQAVGTAIADSGIPREEIFVTTKLWNDDQGYDTALEAIDESLDALGMDYVDLYLIHWPFTKEMKGENKRKETWRAMEEIYKMGKAKAIGVSNYKLEHLKEMENYAEIFPSVNEVEQHPLWVRADIMGYARANDMIVIDYSPLTRGRELEEETIERIAEEHSRSPAQILLRWGIQHGNVVIPKSADKAHIEENLQIFDFELSADEMNELDALNNDQSEI